MKTKIAADGATIKINGSLGNSWKTTIAGNRTIQLLNVDDGDMISVTVVQASPGNFNLTWQASDLTIVWAGGQPPVLPRTVGAAATYHFVREGSNLRQIGSAGALRRRITDAPAQAVSYAIGATALIVALMANSGGSATPGTNPDIAQYFSGSGCTLLLTGTGASGPCSFVRRDTGSGDILITSSGAGLQGVGVGVANLKATSKLDEALLQLKNDGTIISERTSDIGWSVVDGANTACNTTCTNACVFGQNLGTGTGVVNCAAATADRCVCAGAN